MKIPTDILHYRDFWDEPKIFFVRYDGHLILFDCPFNDVTEDFGDFYSVYLMPDLTESEWLGSWVGIANRAVERLGEVAIACVHFDASHRKQIDAAVLSAFSDKLSPVPA